MEDLTSLAHVSPGLTQERLDKALSEWFHEDIKFTRWEYVGETGKGDSYLSEVIRIMVHGSSGGAKKQVQIILKNIPHSKARMLTFRSDEFFKNEIMFYEHVLKGLLEFQATKDVEDPFTEYAKVFLTYSDGVHDCILLEDVSVHGFRACAVRQQGIDLHHCRVTVRTMAKFHALSFAMKAQRPQEFHRISSCIFETYYSPRLWGWYQRFWANLCGVAIDAVSKEYPGTIYEQKVKEFAVPERYQKMVEAASDRTHGVISHGDSWTNNFLYRYSAGAAAATAATPATAATAATPATAATAATPATAATAATPATAATAATPATAATAATPATAVTAATAVTPATTATPATAATAATVIDFQLARCGSPVLDLSFLIYACTTQELREAHYNDLLDLYHSTLSAQISALGSDPAVYDRSTFLDEVKKYSFFGLAFSFESTPFIVLDPEDAVDMTMKGDQKMDINDVWRQIGNFKTKEGRLREANNVKHCVDNGYI